MAIMASGPITSRQIDVETMEAVTDFIFEGSKITAYGDCSNEIKRSLLLGRKAMTKLGSILKSRDITLLTKVHRDKAVVLPVIMYGCESWTIKRAEGWRIDAFELWSWKRFLRAPWTARRSNQSILKEIGPEYSLEGLTLNLKLQYFGHLMQRADSFEKTLMLGKIESRRRTVWDGWRVLSTHGHEFEQTPEFGEGQGSLVCCSMESQRVSYGLVTEKQPGVTIVMYLNTITISLWMNTWSTSNVVFFPPCSSFYRFHPKERIF